VGSGLLLCGLRVLDDDFVGLIVCDMGIWISNMNEVMEFCSCLPSVGKRVSVSAEKIFCGESSGFLFAFWALLLVLYGVLGSVFGVFA